MLSRDPVDRAHTAYDCKRGLPSARRSGPFRLASGSPCGESPSRSGWRSRTCPSEDPRLLRGIGPRNSKNIRAARVRSWLTTTPMSAVGPGQGRFRRVLPRSGDTWRQSSRNEKVRGSNPLSSTKICWSGPGARHPNQGDSMVAPHLLRTLASNGGVHRGFSGPPARPGWSRAPDGHEDQKERRRPAVTRTDRSCRWSRASCHYRSFARSSRSRLRRSTTCAARVEVLAASGRARAALPDQRDRRLVVAPGE
jgi:hypothetical protein